jgi:hypothetical protein
VAGYDPTAVVLPKRTPETFPKHARAALPSQPDGLAAHLERVLLTIELLNDQIKDSDYELKSIAEQDPVCRRLMTVPGVGPVIAIRFVALGNAVPVEQRRSDRAPMLVRPTRGVCFCEELHAQDGLLRRVALDGLLQRARDRAQCLGAVPLRLVRSELRRTAALRLLLRPSDCGRRQRRSLGNDIERRLRSGNLQIDPLLDRASCSDPAVVAEHAAETFAPPYLAVVVGGPFPFND